MGQQGRIGTQSKMNKLVFYGMVTAGLVAAYLMHKRGESLLTIAKNVVTNPVGSLVAEVKTKV